MHLTQLERHHVDLSPHRLPTLVVGYANSLKHSGTILGSAIKTKLRRTGFFDDRKSEIHRQTARHKRLGFAQRFALEACAPGRHVLQLASGHRDVSAELERKLCHVTVIDSKDGSQLPALPMAPDLPANVAWFDQILLLDLIEHLNDPETYLNALRKKMARKGSEIVITVANAAFIMTRIRAELSPRRAFHRDTLIVEARHGFTFKSLEALLERAGYEIVDARGVPVPVPGRFSKNHWSSTLLKINQLLLKISKRLFAYQICIRARPISDGCHDLKQMDSDSVALRLERLFRVA
jgi:hypothetical protein